MKDRDKAPLAAINICNYCNNRCTYCKEGSRDGGEYAALSLAQVKRNIACLVAGKKAGSVILMGGETALRPDFLEILRFMRELGLEAGVGTNLTPFSDAGLMAACAPYISFFEASVPAVTEGAYRAITRSANYGRFMRGMANVAASGIPVTVNIVLSRRTARLLPGILACLDRTFPRGLRMINFKVPMMRGSALKNKGWMCTPAEAFALLRPVLRRHSRGFMMVTGLPLCMMKGYERYSLEAFSRFFSPKNLCMNERTLLYGAEAAPRTPALPECAACALRSFCCVPHERPAGVTLSNKFDVKKTLAALAKAYAPLKSRAIAD